VASWVDDRAVEIGREIALLHEHSYGEPVATPQVSVEEGFVAVLMDIELWKAEQTLIGAGHTEQVRRTREAYQDAVRATFTAIVERATGRRVVGFTSRTVIDEESGSWSVEVFRLG
jgi:uncharacterized protein YbcI